MKDVESLLILPIDLPYTTPDALVRFIAHQANIVIAPDESGSGTNLLLSRPAALRRLTFAYGAVSYGAHHASGRALALSIEAVIDPHIAFDLDKPEHYFAWRRQQETN
jgi:2-phospho-L-lactate guanylyltransferase